ncbi:MAG: hypothetical protein H6Q04_2803 [Acidobacteria bacterium]|nr:hypothetical protein [Acidobacteriota bacterium]
MRKDNQRGINVGRRDFIKTTAVMSMAAALPGAAFPGQDTASSANASANAMKRKLLCLTDSPPTHEKFMETIRSIPEIDLNPVTVNFQKPQEVSESIRGKGADILLMCMPRSAFSFGNLPELMGDLGIPIVLFAQNPDLILIDANFAAAVRTNNANVLFATSQAQALEMIKAVAAPGILEGRRAVIFGRPFDSTSVPAHNLNEDYVYKRTGVRIQYRPMEELKQLFDRIDEASARKEADRWKREAVQVAEPSDKTLLDACRLYVLLRSMIEKEGLSAVSIDCLGLLFNRDSGLPHPCLPFARLRDEGFTAACEADVCGMLSSMFLQEIGRRPSFLFNILSVNLQQSVAVLSHCVSPLKLMGPGAAQLPYKLRDYHGMKQGVVPEVEFPVGIDVMTGAFTKDLKKFVLWPGKIQAGTKKGPDGPAIPGGFQRMTCSNYLELKIRDADRFQQNIAGMHHIMITGDHTKAIREALLRMNVSLIGPLDFKPSQLESI